MKIQNTDWKTISVEKQNGGFSFGYEAPASLKLLRQLQKYGVLVEVTGGELNNRLIRPENSDSQVFTTDQKFRIMEENQTFGRFEKALSAIYGETLPENRFDEFVKWIDPKAFGKTRQGYCLPLNRLSHDKQQELKENLRDFTPEIKDNTIFISGKGNVENLEYSWIEAAKQRKQNDTIQTGIKRGISR